MKRYKPFLASVYVVLLSSAAAHAQVHFTYTNTGNNAIIGIPTSANPKMIGTPLANGDEIGAFTPAGLCVGAVVWPSTNTALAVWGDNDMTPAIDEIQAGEQILFRVWSKSANVEYGSTNVSYSQGNGIYTPNGIYILSSLSATGPLSTPTLSLPSNGATSVSLTPMLNWNASTGATSYQLQVSTSSSFTTTVVNQSGITGTSYAVSSLTSGTTYYWRVNATNGGGISPYSTAWSFITIVATPSAPTLSSPLNRATSVSTIPTLSWNASPGASSYRLQVSRRSTFFTTIVNQSGITGTSYAVRGLAYGTTYYWRVNATNSAEISAYSPTWMFKTVRKGVKLRGVLSTEEIDDLPTKFSLSENYPNPFNPSTIIEFSLPQSEFVTLKVFNIMGQEIATLLAGETEAGTHKIAFDASSISTFSSQQTELGSGVYFYRLTAGEFTATKKMVLIR